MVQSVCEIRFCLVANESPSVKLLASHLTNRPTPPNVLEKLAVFNISLRRVKSVNITAEAVGRVEANETSIEHIRFDSD